ncbi:EpsG family protein [Bacteroides sp.]|uniref:EpsG family protein n=1 Tax=Bacteroides sp. TaxID=29523 RepID=UPI002A83CE9B|nr:EpsG family protein [Bacteroides sp.]
MTFSFLILLNLVFILLSIAKRNLILILWVVCFIYIYIIATRSMEVPDTVEYIGFYEQLEAGDFSTFIYFSFEPGFQLLGHIIKLFFGNSAILFLAVVVVINIVLILLSIRKIAFRLSLSSYSINFISAIVLYFAYFGLFYNAIVLRAGIAISILVYSTTILFKKDFNKKDVIKILLLFGLALTFHLSSIVGIIALIFSRRSQRLTEKSYLLIWCFIAFLFFSGSSVYIVKGLLNVVFSLFSLLSDSDYKKYEYYLSELDHLDFQIPYKYLFQLFSGLLLLFVKGNIDTIYYKYLNLYFIGLFLGAIFSSIEQIARITDYFLIYLFILQWMYFIQSYGRVRGGKSFLYPISVILQLAFVFRIINPTY